MQDNLKYATKEQKQASKIYGCWWKTPEETYCDGFGFCYDLASFALECLLCSNLAHANILFVAWGDWGKDSNAGHFVCTYRIDSFYYCIDNGYLKGPYSFDQLLQVTARNRAIHTHRFIESDHIHYHLKYQEMGCFLED